MPSKTPDGKPISGAAGRKRAKQKTRSKPLLADLPEPPKDATELVLWGATAAARGAHKLATMRGALDGEKFRLFQGFLATLGMLFPRSEMVARLKKAKAARDKTVESKEVTPREGIPPGPGSRRSRGGGGTPPS
jgi:hypothetical protein